jgi:hypothetical protein
MNRHASDARNEYGFPETDARVPRHTSERSNQDIRQRTLRNLSSFSSASARQIDERIEALRHEWDIERTLEANAAAVALGGLALGIAVDRRFLVVPALVGGFLLQHALQGWCPPLPLFRKLGVRTSKEIHAEILALRLLRDDFATRAPDAEAALAQASAR